MNSCEISEIKINYIPRFKMEKRPKVTSSSDAKDLFIKFWDDDIQYRESFAVMLLNRSNKFLGISFVSKGGIAGTIADPKMIFQVALKANASSIILSHNHPSGNIKPSDTDITLTNKIKRAGDALDMSVLDHLILTQDAYYSFADESIM